MSSRTAVVALLVLLNAIQGHCTFYSIGYQGHFQGHQQPSYEIQPPNKVGYGFKPYWADIHFQPIIEQTSQPHSTLFQQTQPEKVKQEQKESMQIEQIAQQNQSENIPAEQPQQHEEISQLNYISPASTQYIIQQPGQQPIAQLDKYQTIPQPLDKYQNYRYQWVVQPSVNYQLPLISNPFIHREPQHQVYNVLIPLKSFGVQQFPPLIERLLQRVQNYFSVYNPPETLTVPYNPYGVTPPTFTTSSLLPSAEEDQQVGIVPSTSTEQEIGNDNASGFIPSAEGQQFGIVPSTSTEQEMGSDNASGFIPAAEGQKFGIPPSTSTEQEIGIDNASAFITSTEDDNNNNGFGGFTDNGVNFREKVIIQDNSIDHNNNNNNNEESTEENSTASLVDVTNLFNKKNNNDEEENSFASATNTKTTITASTEDTNKETTTENSSSTSTTEKESTTKSSSESNDSVTESTESVSTDNNDSSDDKGNSTSTEDNSTAKDDETSSSDNTTSTKDETTTSSDTTTTAES